MKNSHYRGVLKILEWITNLALYASIGISVIVIIAFVFSLSDEGELVSAWDVEIGEQLTGFQVMSKSASIDDPKIIINSGTVQFTSRSIGYYLLKFVDATIVILCAIYIIILLKRTIHSIHQHHPFTKENALRIKRIAFTLILISFYSLVKSMVYHIYIINSIGIKGKTFTDIFELSRTAANNEIRLVPDINFQALLIGIVLLVIAEVFREGVLIKEDNDSIL